MCKHYERFNLHVVGPGSGDFRQDGGVILSLKCLCLSFSIASAYDFELCAGCVSFWEAEWRVFMQTAVCKPSAA